METVTAINNPAPVAQADRIKTVDMIRGFALLGILLMNIPGFGINWDVWYNVLHGPHNTKDYYTFASIISFFDGTMRGLFSMLFGAGMILFTQNKKELPDGPSVAEFYYRRLLWLLIFGMFNAFILLWFGDILYFYAICGMLLFVFRKTSPKWLFILAIATMSITMYKTQSGWSEMKEKRVAYLEAVKAEKDSIKLKPEQQAAKAEWTEIERRRSQGPDTTFINRNLRKMQSGYGTIFTYWVPMNVDGETYGLYHQWFWDGLTMMFVGMALLGLGFFSNKLSTSTYTMWLLIGYGIGLPLGYLIFKKGILLQVSDFTYYFDRYRTSPDLLYDLRRGLISIGHASLLMLIYRSKIVPWLMKALANVGQMAFTNYLMQSIICTWFFYGYGFGFYNKLKFHELYYVVFAVWIFQLIFSSIWLRYFRFGPFEWLWRSLTYWKKQPMRK
jgi:uncharacterized protein